MKTLALCFFLMVLAGNSLAQDAGLLNSTKLGFGFTRFGFGFHYENPIFSSNSELSGYHLNTELGNIMNPQEIAVINPNLSGQRGAYKLEKVGYAWSLKPLLGKTFLINKVDPNGVMPVFKASLGPSISYVWPVYINYLSVDSATQNALINEVRYDPEIHNQELIAERASFANDISKGTFQIGLAARVGFDFFVSNNTGGYRAIGVGARFEYYPKSKLSIYYDENLNRQMYSSFYINFAVGN